MGGRGDFRNRIENARTCLAMDHQHMGDGRISCQNGCHLITARRQIITLVEQMIMAPQIIQRFRRPQTISTIGKHENLAVTRDKTAEHGFDSISA